MSVRVKRKIAEALDSSADGPQFHFLKERAAVLKTNLQPAAN
jgi:hypothetical protein